jgi:hypothetical protein
MTARARDAAGSQLLLRRVFRSVFFGNVDRHISSRGPLATAPRRHRRRGSFRLLMHGRHDEAAGTEPDPSHSNDALLEQTSPLPGMILFVSISKY